MRKTGAFTAVKPEVLNFIEGFRTDSLAVAAGGALVRENQTNAKLFTLYSGWAFRYKTMSDGRRQILNFLLPGDLVGLQQEFGDVSAHGIEALTDCSLCVFQNDSLWALFREHPRLGYDITWLSAHEEGHVDDNLLTAGRRNATERVAMLIMHLYRRLDRIGLVEDGWHVVVQLPGPGPLADALTDAGAQVEQETQFVLRKRLLRPRDQAGIQMGTTARQQLLQPPLVHAPRLDEIAPVVATGVGQHQMHVGMVAQRLQRPQVVRWQ